MSEQASPPLRLDPTWLPSLAHRQRVLLHTFPLHALHRADTMRDQELRHYDTLALALATIDLIVDHMGLGRDVGRGRVLEHLTPLLTEMDGVADVAPDGERHARIVDRVIGALRNDEQRRRPFEASYLDVDEGKLVRRIREFRLVYDQFHPDGGTVLRLSNEAINLFLNALELPIEDAQAAAEAIVQSQLARGRLDEALESARAARLQSVRYKTRVEKVLRDTRRDVMSIDWRADVPQLLDEALTHVGTRLAVEQNIVAAAHERLDLLVDGDERGTLVAEIARLVRECMLLHTELQSPLMRARNVFLDEQARQRFIAPPLQPRPEIAREVLDPVLSMRAMDAVGVVEPIQSIFFGAVPKPILSLRQLVEWQLRPRREVAAPAPDVEPLDLMERALDPTRFPEEIRELVREMLASLDGPRTLSDLLAQMLANGAPAPAIDALALFATDTFAQESPEGTALQVERAGAAASFRAAGWFGDDLVLSPGEARRA